MQIGNEGIKRNLSANDINVYIEKFKEAINVGKENPLRTNK